MGDIHGNKFEFDPRRHRYTLNGREMTGVTTVLGVINKPALVPWAAGMATESVRASMNDLKDSPELIFANLDDILDKAKAAHTARKDSRASSGANTHKQIEELINVALEGFDGYIQHSTNPDKQVQQFIQWSTENKVQYLASEKVMYHPEWFVGGTVDFVAVIDGKKYIGDIKTQKKIWDRVPFFQMAAYRGMLESMGEKDFHGSIIIHLPEVGRLKPHFSFDYESDLEGFLAALKLYRLLNNY